MGLQKEGKNGKESEVTSPLKPKHVISEEVVVGYMDVGLNEEKKPNVRGSWKKLARAQGLAESGTTTAQKEEEVGTKRTRKIEKKEAEEVRKKKKTHEDAPNGEVLMIDETAVGSIAESNDYFLLELSGEPSISWCIARIGATLGSHNRLLIEDEEKNTQVCRK